MITLAKRKEFSRIVATTILLLTVVLALGLISSAQAAFVGGPPPTSTPFPVGGEVGGIDTISVFLSTYWLLIVILIVPLAFALYKKRSVIPKWFMR